MPPPSDRGETARPAACRVLGADCFVGGVEEAAAELIERALGGEGGFVSLLNVHLAMTAQRDAAVSEAVSRAWRVLPDGAPIAWLERRKGARRAQRVGGPDLMLAVLDRGRLAGVRHFLFGSLPEVVERLEARLRGRLAGVEIVGAYAPPPGRESDPGAVRLVRDAQPHVVWVALGAPRQELWAARFAGEVAPALVVCVGAAFDFHAGTKTRAPLWMQRHGLEWLHRLVKEPRRLGWRYLSTNSLFVIHALRELAGAAFRPAVARRT